MPELRKLPSNPLVQVLWLLLQGLCIWGWVAFDLSQPPSQRVQLAAPVILGLATGALLTGLITLSLRGLKSLRDGAAKNAGSRRRQAQNWPTLK